MQKQETFKNIPIGVFLIAAFYTFGAFVLFTSIFTNPSGVSQTIALVHGFSPTMGVEVLLAVSILALVLAYGLVRLARWGFFLMLAYSLYMAGVSLYMGGLSFVWTGQADMQRYFGNILWSVLVVVYLLIVRHRFLK